MTFFRKFGPWILGCFVLSLDFLSKQWTHASLPRMSESLPIYPYGGVGIFKNFFGVEFSLSHATNKGAAWGLGSEYQVPLLILRIILLTALFVWILFYNKNLKFRYPFALILAGALGNVADYFIYGHVVDMFHFVLWGYDYPVFNLADSAIFIGILWLFIQSYFPSTANQKF